MKAADVVVAPWACVCTCAAIGDLKYLLPPCLGPCRDRAEKAEEDDEFKGLTQSEIKFILKKRERVGAVRSVRGC